jgi:hypothetical protein
LRLRLEDKFTDSTAVINATPNLKVMTEEPILQMGTDKLIMRHVYDKPFTIRFPERREWKDKFQPDRKRGLLWYKDGSKKNKGTGAGVFSYRTMQKLSFNLEKYTKVFQADICAIKE